MDSLIYPSVQLPKKHDVTTGHHRRITSPSIPPSVGSNLAETAPGWRFTGGHTFD